MEKILSRKIWIVSKNNKNIQCKDKICGISWNNIFWIDITISISFRNLAGIWELFPASCVTLDKYPNFFLFIFFH